MVEVAPPPSPPVRPRPAKAAPAAKGGPPPQRRRLGRWAALTAGASCLAAVALVLVLARWPARARSVPPAEVAAQEAKSPGAPPVAPTGAPDDVWPADRQGSDRESFGTAVEFVRNPSEAGRVADRQHKLTFLLHVSGNFEDSCFT